MAMVILAMSSACSPAGRRLDLVPVSGTVTFDGRPLADGRIEMRMAHGGSRAFGGRIERGRFRLDAVVGTYAVAITAWRDTGKIDRTSNPGCESPIREMFIPARFNDSTELVAEVARNGKNHFDFPLTTSPQPAAK